jgi:ferredoxin-NADP reductase
MLRYIDKRLNGMTMYRVVMYALCATAAVGILDDPSRAWSLAALLAVGRGANWAFAKMVGAAENAESATITSLILFHILFPASTLLDFAYLAFAAMVAMASKYLVTWHRRHIFNPAALAAFVVGLLGWGAAWWVGSAAMLPMVALGGLLVARKTRRLAMLSAFVASAFAGMWLSARWFGQDVSVVDSIAEGLVSWPILFFGAFMLTEPLTLPASRAAQVAEAALVGFLFAMPFSAGPIHSSPELSLLIGNAFAWACGAKRTSLLKLVRRTEMAPGVYDFAFEADSPPRFRAGQYFEWTLPHSRPDARGNRRTFTVASAPSEPSVRIGVCVPDLPSTFKAALMRMEPGDELAASNVGGEFVLPRDPSVKLALVAGGIGVTPFRSMAEDLVRRCEHRDVVLIYACRTADGFVYDDVFERAEAMGWRVIRRATATEGHLTGEALAAAVPDFADRLFYVSGPNAMVESARRLLRGLGVKGRNVRTDYFPGY